MICRRQEFRQYIFRLHLKTGCAYTGMASKILALQHILIYQKLHRMFTVIHEPHYADRSRFYIQIFQHILRIGKRQSRRIDLCRKLLGFELLIPRHHQKIKNCLLSVTKKQILADDHTKNRIYLVTCFHIACRLMISPYILYAQFIKKIIGSDLTREPPINIFRSSFK
ncbi:MAG: hypothetical protein BWY61_01840 [Firmicutes bacterium ADurb.Bin354]|nr:MAG: hypothetical protein BWY61_01840 [Firmicutes bacterium ADurb.Bin354]